MRFSLVVQRRPPQPDNPLVLESPPASRSFMQQLAPAILRRADIVVIRIDGRALVVIEQPGAHIERPRLQFPVRMVHGIVRGVMALTPFQQQYTETAFGQHHGGKTATGPGPGNHHVVVSHPLFPGTSGRRLRVIRIPTLRRWMITQHFEGLGRGIKPDEGFVPQAGQLRAWITRGPIF